MGTNTGIGIGIGIPFKNFSSGGRQPLPPDLKASLKGVWIAYGKSNNDADRSIVKNLVDPDNPFVISNAAYDKMSSYGGYEFAKFDNTLDWYNIEGNDSVEVVSRNGHSITLKRLTGPNFWYFRNSTFRGLISNVIPFKVNSNKNITVIWDVHGLSISEGKDKSARVQELVLNPNEDNYTNLKTLNEEELAQIDISTNSLYYLLWFDLSTLAVDEEVTIEMLPQFEGAFVTDGIDDLITSTKTVQEMLGGSNEITVVSMAHFIKGESNAPEICRINQIRRDTRSIRNSISKIGKSGIFGYTYKNGVTTINNILGDKNDCIAEGNLDGIVAPFSVEGYYYNNNSNPLELCSIAWYWTIIANKVLTTDQINQVIAYFNLDRTLNPDILCNTIKQGITNENHAEFGDKLIDYSGNGRDIQLNNIAWNKESGIDDDGALRLDGVNDFGQFVGDLELKDYTFIADRAYSRIASSQVAFIASTQTNGQAPFLMEYLNEDTYVYPHSFGATTKTTNLNIQRQVSYQSTYVYNGNSISKGTSVDTGDGLTIGNSGSTGAQYSPLCLWSLMLFPYSMSEFLIERQLKKHKLGTLYPNMVEFRPIINSNVKWDTIEIWQASKPLYRPALGTNETGSYIIEDSTIGIYVKPFVGQKVSKIVYNGTSYTDLKANNNGFYYITVPVTKSPQKIGITIEQDENYVLFNPVINSNYDNYRLTFHLREYEKLINIGDYIPKGTYIRANLYLKNNIDELVTFTFNGVNIDYRRSPYDDTTFNIRQIYNYDSPQEVNITIDEYIRYEEIVQPYPVIFQITDRNTNQRYSWGDKIKVGSSIRLSQGEKPNLLSGLYSIQSYEYEGETYSYNQLTNLNIILTKQSISLSCNKIWLLDNNEPKCILSPRLLRIPNSSYKILGYIPDISGHGNHGVIHNSAYAEGSGVNEDGSYQFDGVDDFVTIPTIAGKQVLIKLNWQHKAIGNLIYDQRDNGSTTSFAILPISINDTTKNRIAYQEKNANGITYIDGIRNEYIESYSLENIIHNITITNPDVSNKTVVLGASNRTTADHFAKYALYDFMLFDEISTEAKIKELNTYIGITPKVTLPNYYWDNYGKKNTDANRGHVDEQVSLQKTGTSVNPLENFNISYEGMSGYNGYPVVFGASKTWESLSGAYGYTSNVTNTTIHVTHAEHAGNGLLFSYVKKDGALANIKEIPAFRVTIGGLEGNSKFGYRYLATEDATKETSVYLGNGTHELAKSFAPTEALLDLTRNVWVGIFITPMIEGEVVFDCDITIEVLPEYENGLAYDGVSDFSQNTEIEVVEDFTFLVKGSLLKGLTGSGGCIARKGDKKHYDTGGYAFIYCFDSPIEFYRNSYYSFGESFIPSKEIVAPPLIGYMTKTNVNGETTTFGTNSDIKGIIFGNGASEYMNMVIYKSIFYTKTISLLEINFLKNLMEKDEIIDINHPIFISNTEGESNTSQDT